MRLPRGKIILVILGSVLLGLAPGGAGAQVSGMPNLGSPVFQRHWARTDYPVATGRVQRSYYFGPEPLMSCEEFYQEAPNNRRLVTYMDKARLELTNPASETVTAGLLAKELISGQMQFGNASFENFGSANVPVAGDPGDSPAPTYASFARVASIDPGTNKAGNRVGRAVTATLNRAGDVGDDPSLGRYGATIAEYSDALGHNVPNVFIEFFNRRGTIAVVSGDSVSYREDRLIDWIQVMGLPIAEPYWAVVPVAGQSKWVLMQPFERRVVTYTPDNSDAFKVEMGNIGQHYKTWRHRTGTCQLRPAPSGPVGDPVPDGVNATVNKKIGFWGAVFRFTFTGFTPNEGLSYWITAPNGGTLGTPRPVNVQHQGTISNLPIYTDQRYPVGVWAVTMEGAKSGKQAIAYFRIVDRPALPTDLEPTPAAVNGAVSPPAGWQGTVFRVAAAGFKANEPIGYWLNAPDGTIYGSRRQINVQHPGRIGPLPIYSDEEMEPGVWSIVFQGSQSGSQAVIYFRVVGTR